MTIPVGASATRAVESLRHSARDLARRESWPELCALLRADEEVVQSQPDLVTLLGEAFMRTGHPRDARDWLLRTMHAIERRHDRASLRRAVNLLGAAGFALGELGDARGEFEQVLQLAREDGDDLLVARATNNLGLIANVRGEREQASTMYSLAIAAYQRLGDARGLAESTHNLAITYRHLGLLMRADDLERRAMEFARQAGNAWLLALARLGRAEVSHAMGDAPLAEVGARHAAGEFAKLGDPIQQAGALRLLGEACLSQKKRGEARWALECALELARAHGSALDEAEILHLRARLHEAGENRLRARADACAAHALFVRLDARAQLEAIVPWLEGELGGLPVQGGA